MTEGVILAWLVAAGLYLTGALVSLLIPRRARVLAHAYAAAGGFFGVEAAIAALSAGTVERAELFSAAPYATFVFRIDPLSAWFLLALSISALAVSVYSIGYVDEEDAGLMGAGYNLFLASMVLVLLADTTFTFLFCWEVMSLVSFGLVMRDHHQAEVRRAGRIYLIMTHVGTAFILAAFLVLSQAGGSLDFEAFRTTASALPAATRDVVFLLALVGFGAKAGIIPLHVWLPRAHPAAPSHVSALMSGVMIKTAVYGLVRVTWEFAGPGQVWWGALILALGAASAVLGILYTLMESDLKRLLAYSSVENMGIIFIGLGAGQALAALGQPEAAALALAAALFHVLNHAVFKSLLFLGAGAIQHATHTRNLERLGGLIHAMPWTAATFLMGAAARMSALPPLNGFMSEWLTFQSLLRLAGAAGEPAGVAAAAAVVGLLAMTGGLAAFAFVKAFGIAFLGMPRNAAAPIATEVNRPMLAGMGLLAVLCLGLGLGAPAVMTALVPVTGALTGRLPEQPFGVLAAVPSTSGATAPAGLLLALLLMAAIGLVTARLLGGPAWSRIAPPWVCGIAIEPGMQYTASALVKPIRIIFHTLIRPEREIEREQALQPYFVTSVHYRAGVTPVYERYLYAPVVGGLVAAAHRIRMVQSGSLRLYLGYMFATVVAVLLLSR